MIDLLVIIFAKVKYVRDDLKIIARRYHVDMVAKYPHSVPCLDDRHAGILAQYICEETLVIGSKMLNDDKCHARVSGQECKELLKRFEAAC